MTTSFGVENEAYTATEMENKAETESELDIEILYTNGTQKNGKTQNESNEKELEDFEHRLKGSAFISMREKRTKKTWRRQSLNSIENYNNEQPL